MSKGDRGKNLGSSFFERFNQALSHLDDNFAIRVLDCRRGGRAEMELNVVRGREEFIGNSFYYLTLEVSHRRRRMVSLLRFHLSTKGKVEDMYADVVGPIELRDKDELTDPKKREQFDQLIGRTQRFLRGPLAKKIEDQISGKRM